MSNQLSHMPSRTSIEDLRQISTVMQQYINTENDETIQMALEKINQSPGLLARFFPGAIKREQQHITLERMRAIYKSKEKFFNLYIEIQLEIAKKQGDALIASVGMDLQASLTVFATDRIDDITRTIGESRQKFLQRITPELQDLDRYKNFSDIYEPAHESIKQEIKTYFEGINELLKGFIQALGSKVSSSKT